MKYCFLIYILIAANCYSQTEAQDNSGNLYNSTYYANTQSVHPLGLFISRVNNNFQIAPDQRMSVTTSYSSGNVWLPYVKSYAPINNEDRLAMQNYLWHERESRYDVSNSPSKTMEFHADGIIREYQIKLNFPISDKHEIKVNNRMFSIDAGEIPYSLLSSDQFIEWFHSNIYGGEDPFARKVYGFNQAKISYTDSHGEKIELDKGDFVFSGIDLSYYYYPDSKFLKSRNIYTNLGLQTGINTSKVNPSLDLGLNVTILKMMKLKNRAKEIRLGLSTAALGQKLVHFGPTVELSNKAYIFSLELLLEYVKHINERSYFSVATSWLLQSSYFRKSDYESLVLTGQRASTHWHYALSHLYRKLSSNSLVFTYARNNIAFWVYLKEDLLVDNAPDAQTGLGIRFYLK